MFNQVSKGKGLRYWRRMPVGSIFLTLLLAALITTPSRGQELSGAPSEESSETYRSSSQSEPGQSTDPSSDWWKTVSENIAESEYFITWQSRTGLKDLSSAWQAPSRSQGFRAYWSDRALRLIPLNPDETQWDWGLRLITHGDETDANCPVKISASVSRNRIDRYLHGVHEWSLNESKGLEQGFILDSPSLEPGTESADAQLSAPFATNEESGHRAEQSQSFPILTLEVSGSLSMKINGEGSGAMMTAPSIEHVLRYVL